MYGRTDRREVWNSYLDEGKIYKVFFGPKIVKNDHSGAANSANNCCQVKAQGGVKLPPSTVQHTKNQPKFSFSHEKRSIFE